MGVSVLHGDCIELMRDMAAGSVDAIVTDPPYGLGFMGKAWDALPPGAEWAAECLRVLKPGGYLLAFGGTRTWHRLAVAVEDAGFEIRDSIAWMHGQGFPKGKANLKPAFEPVVVARRKPDAPRTGLLNIDAARVQMSSEDREFIETRCRPNTRGVTDVRPESPVPDVRVVNVHSAGRWPANVILDESQAEALDQQSGTLTSGALDQSRIKAKNGDGWRFEGERSNKYEADSGGASRFFYVAKPSKRERPQGDVTHPTVKPLKLMRYLVRLVTPENGTVLDPFAGSGTTLEAAILEGFNALGIEREADYLPLIQTRLDRCGLLT